MFFEFFDTELYIIDYTIESLIAGSRRARNLVCTPYLEFGGNLFLPKSIDKSS